MNWLETFQLALLTARLTFFAFWGAMYFFS
jgi:hypothetical protein